MCVDYLLDDKVKKEGKAEARERLLDVLEIIPDGGTQREVVEKMWEVS